MHNLWPVILLIRLRYNWICWIFSVLIIQVLTETDHCYCVLLNAHDGAAFPAKDNAENCNSNNLMASSMDSDSQSTRNSKVRVASISSSLTTIIYLMSRATELFKHCCISLRYLISFPFLVTFLPLIIMILELFLFLFWLFFPRGC